MSTEVPFLIYSTGYPGNDSRQFKDAGTPLYWEEIRNPNNLDPTIPRLPTSYSYTTQMFPTVDNVRFEDCNFEGNGLYHIRADYTRNLVIKRCCGVSEIGNKTSIGIWIYNSIGARVEHCRFTGGRHGLALTGSINTIFCHNVLDGQTQNGIWGDEASHDTTWEHNTISNTKWAGIAADQPTRLIIRYNHLDKCGDPESAEPGGGGQGGVAEGRAGIRIKDPIKVHIHGNQIYPKLSAIRHQSYPGGTGTGHWVSVRMFHDRFRPTWYRDAEENVVELHLPEELFETCENGFADNNGNIDASSRLNNLCCINHNETYSNCCAESGQSVQKQ